MKTVAGRDVVSSLLELATEISYWNKKYTTKATLQEKLDELGLTAHQVEVLGFIYANPELDTVSKLATELFISKGSLSLMLSKLQQNGFVHKRSAKGADDGRKVYVSLTEKGALAVEEMRDAMLGSAGVAFDNMEEEKRVLFYTKLEELRELFHAGGWKE